MNIGETLLTLQDCSLNCWAQTMTPTSICPSQQQLSQSLPYLPFPQLLAWESPWQQVWWLTRPGWMVHPSLPTWVVKSSGYGTKVGSAETHSSSWGMPLSVPPLSFSIDRLSFSSSSVSRACRVFPQQQIWLWRSNAAIYSTIRAAGHDSKRRREGNI